MEYVICLAVFIFFFVSVILVPVFVLVKYLHVGPLQVSTGNIYKEASYTKKMIDSLPIRYYFPDIIFHW